jgi:hypothetical protein
MSKTENATEISVQPIKTKKTYEYFDENLVLQSKEVEVVYTPVDSQEKAVEELNKLGSWIDAANFAIRRNALREAKKNAGVSGGINRNVLMEFIKPYRELPNFASMISVSDKRKATAEEWDRQTNAILEQIKNVPFIMEAIKARSAAEAASDEE